MHGGYTTGNGSHTITVPKQGIYLVIIQHASNDDNTAMYLVRKTTSSGYFTIVPNEHTSLTVNNIGVDMDITITQDNFGSALVSLINLSSFSLFNKLPFHDS